MSGRIKSAAKHQFSPYLSCRRIRSIQEVLKREESKTDGPRAILAVLGVDGRFNEGCRELANYLTFGFFSTRQLELEKAGLEEEDIEDVIFFIQQDSVSVYCGAFLYNFLLPYISHWKNVQVYCREQQQEEQDRDTDVEEMYKVKSFISMIRGCKVIGIPYLGSASVQNTVKDKALTLEKWPLIQSYASADIGCGKAFTLDHTTVNIREQILSLYGQCGPFVLEKTMSTSYPLFTRHWNEALSAVDNAIKSKSILTLKEDQVLEPLQCYYKHGQLSKPKGKSNVPDPARRPFVLFGSRSAERGKDLKPISMKAAARKGRPAPNHMVIQCVSPNGPLLCTRTYFFKSQSKPGATDKELSDLVHLYTTCIQGASSAVNEFATTLSAPKAEKKAVEHLLSKGMSCSLVFDAKCSIAACNKYGKKVVVAEGRKEATMNVIKISAENVKASHGGDVIGSIVYSDTFMISTFEVLNLDGTSKQNTVCDVLTSDIPAYFEWPLETTKSDVTLSDDDPLSLCRDMTVCSASELYSPPCVATMQFNHDGSVIITAKNMNDIVLKSGIQYHDSPAPGEVCLVVISFDLPENAPLWEHVPAHFRGNVNIVPDIVLSQPSKCLVLALLPGSQAYKEFYAVIVHHVHNVPLTPLTLKKMKSLSSDLNNLYSSIQSSYKSRKPIKKETLMPSSGGNQSKSLKDFVNHLTISYAVGDLSVHEYAVASLLQEQRSSPLESASSDGKVVVSILCSLPCCGTDNISQQLVSLNKEKVRWVVVRPSFVSGADSTLDKQALEEQLSQAVTHKKIARPSAAARKKLRIIILAAGFYDLCEVVQCVTHHSDIAVCEQLCVGAVTTCILPGSIYHSERQNFPKFFSSCLPGIVNNFAFVTPEQEIAGEMDKNLVAAQFLVRCVNKQAAFLICPGGKLVRKSDFDLVLAEDIFSTTKMIHERFLLRPDLCIGKYKSGRSVPTARKVTLEFSQPLIKGAFLARVRSLRSSLKHPQVIGSVSFVSGCVAFTESPKQEYDLNFASVMHEVELIPRVIQSGLPAPPTARSAWMKSKPYSLDFYGINLDEEALKDWLRKSGRQKPSKKCHKTRNHLTKDEIQMIHEENSTRHLPEGYFYNGSFYVSLFDNKKLIHHPNMQKFIDEYLEAENEEISAYNAEIDRQNIKDIFD